MTSADSGELMCVFFDSRGMSVSAEKLGHSHDLAFLTAAEIPAYLSRRSRYQVQRAVPLSDPILSGMYWVCEGGSILSTEQVLSKRAAGERIQVATGPHASASDAHDCLDAAWESPGND